MNAKAYLIKQAVEPIELLMGGGTLGGGYLAGELADAGANTMLSDVVARQIERSAGKMSPKERRAIQKGIGGVKKVPVHVVGPKKLHHGSEYFAAVPGKKGIGEVVITKRTPDFVLAHELGHAKVKPTFFSKRMSRLEGLSERHGKMLGGGAGALWAALSADPEESALRTGVESGLKGALTGVASHAPILAHEGAASFHGLRGMARAGVPWRSMARSVPGLAALFGTYLASAALPSAGVAAGAGLIAREVKKRQLKRELRKARREGKLGR